MPIALEQITRFIKDSFVQRGEEYLRRGAVVSAEVTGGKKISGTVLGSGRKSYRQSINLTFSRTGRLLGIEGLCTCSVGYNCKHVAAVLLAAADEIELPEPSQPNLPAAATPMALTLPPEIETWLQSLQEGDRALKNQETELPERMKERIFYLLDLDRHRKLVIQPMKGLIKKDGGVGAGARAYNTTNLHYDQPPRFVLPADLRIFRMLQAYGLNSRLPGSQGPQAEAEDLEALVVRVVETGRAHWHDLANSTLFIDGKREAELVWQSAAQGAQELVLEDTRGQRLQALPTKPALYVDPVSGGVGHLEQELPIHVANALVAAPPVPPEAAGEVAKVLRGLSGSKLPLPETLKRVTRKGGKPVPHLTLFTLTARQKRSPYYDYGAQEVSVPAYRITFDYQGHLTPAYPRKDPQFGEAGQVVRLTRDLDAEDRYLAHLKDSGAHAPDAYRYLTFAEGQKEGDQAFPESDRFEEWVFADLVEGEEKAALTFTAETLPRLRNAGWQIDVTDTWPYRIHDGPVTFAAGIEEEASGVDWFSFSLTVEAGEQSLDLLPIVLSVVRILPVEPGGDLPEDFDLDFFLEDLVLYPDLPDGSLLRLEGDVLAPIVRACLGVYGLGHPFHRAEADKISALAEALTGSGIPFDGGDNLRLLGDRLRRVAELPEVQAPPGLKGKLRPYQSKGYGWLAALGDCGFGGCLADDMGLGKTIQALSLLVKRHLVEGTDLPSLLVVPTSLIGNWQREAYRFAPDLSILVLHGTQRKALFPQIPKHDLVITTYPLINRDYATLFRQEFEVAILDEAQAVKNPTSNAAKRIRSIRARQRVAMTGTPIENNLQELWSLYDWLVPGLLGDRKSFKDEFRTPIEKDGDSEAQARLNGRIQPFLLRRTKEAVAPDLPEKTEITELVPLDGSQRSLYESLRTAMDSRVRQAIREKGMSASRITILDALLKLRQACCDPALVKLDRAGEVNESAKRERLLEMLESLVEEGRRVLVFSQFVEMLRLIEGDVRDRGWDYCLLTGETKQRQREVERFQQGKAPIFLISLKAGGVGLNLTAADTVILYDPWWNPAVERQAMDRAHRIGQDKTVFVYRLVAEGTVESAIQELQAKKQALADALFEGRDAGQIGFSEEDLAALFQPLEDAA
ncbi:MAG: DEAD/DEAH box helicase [Pseudomonadota bacterium]